MFSSLVGKPRPVELILRWGGTVCGSPPHATSVRRIRCISVPFVDVMPRENPFDPVGDVIVVLASSI